MQNPLTKLAELSTTDLENMVNVPKDFIHSIEQKAHEISITDIINKSKCMIPSGVSNIARAALLQQCVSPSSGK